MATPVSRRTRTTIAAIFALGLPLLWLTIARAAAPTWSPAAPMGRPRAVMTATSLPDGRVLVVGGVDSAAGVALSSAEIYDPASDTWSPAGTMSTARYYHVAAALADGRVLVAGGVDASGFSITADIYDAAAMTWSPAPAMIRARVGAAAMTLSDGRVLVIGGFDGSTVLADGELYDPVTNTWSLTGPTKEPRFFAIAQALPDGRVLAAGGYDPGRFDSVDSAEMFDPATNNWTAMASMHERRVFHASVSLSDGRVLVIGGARAATAEFWTDGEVYDPASDSWMLTPSTGGVGGLFLAAAGRADDRVLAVGGSVASVPTSLAALYDPAANTWSAAPPMSVTRYGHVAVPVSGARTLVAGGVGMNSAEAFAAPNHPPIANAGADQTLRGCIGCLVFATLDGSGSSDVDGDALTYTWSEGETIFASGAATSVNVALGVGTHAITLTVTDGAGGTATDALIIVVEDSVGALTAKTGGLEADLAEARDTIARLKQQLADIRADDHALRTRLDGALSGVERDMRREFRDPRFAIRGRTPLARVQNLAEAIVELSRGHKQALYRGLGGR